MNATFLILILTLAYLAGVATLGTLFCLADWYIRRRHNLVTEDQVDAALRNFERVNGGAS